MTDAYTGRQTDDSVYKETTRDWMTEESVQISVTSPSKHLAANGKKKTLYGLRQSLDSSFYRDFCI